MSGPKDKQSALDQSKKHKTINRVWRPVCTPAISNEECSVKDVIVESDDGSQVQEVLCSTSSNVSSAKHTRKVDEAATEITDSTISSCALQDNSEDKVFEGESVLTTEKHSISVEAAKSQSLNYSHFISLPLAIHPELVSKLVNFQNSILGNRNQCLDENLHSDSNEDTTVKEDEDQQLNEKPDAAVELKVDDDNERSKVNINKIPIVSYPPKASKTSTFSELIKKKMHLQDLGIDQSIFIQPKTFHLTVLMLKLWNMDRVNAATKVLQSISSKVMDALDNHPVSVRLKGLDCMKGSLAKARVLYVPVEEIGSEARLLRACQVIIDAYVEAGLVLEKDATQKLKLHATVMNTSHRKRTKQTRKFDSFDARGIFNQYGSEEWGEYLIREAHLSQRFVFDENGYYHCCGSIPFPENMQVD